jgi:hypothetical protein
MGLLPVPVAGILCRAPGKREGGARAGNTRRVGLWRGPRQRVGDEVQLHLDLTLNERAEGNGVLPLHLEGACHIDAGLLGPVGDGAYDLAAKVSQAPALVVVVIVEVLDLELELVVHPGSDEGRGYHDGGTVEWQAHEVRTRFEVLTVVEVLPVETVVVIAPVLMLELYLGDDHV